MNSHSLSTIVALSLLAAPASAATTRHPGHPRVTDCDHVKSAKGKLDSAVRAAFGPGGAASKYANAALAYLRVEQVLLTSAMGLATTRVMTDSRCAQFITQLQGTRGASLALVPLFERVGPACAARGRSYPGLADGKCLGEAKSALRAHESAVNGPVRALLAHPALQSCAPGLTGLADLALPFCARRAGPDGNESFCSAIGGTLRDIDKNLHRARADHLEKVKDSLLKDTFRIGIIPAARRGEEQIHALRFDARRPNLLLFESGANAYAAAAGVAPAVDIACERPLDVHDSH